MINKISHSTLDKLRIRQVTRADLMALEWEGEYQHYRQIFKDAYLAAQRGDAVLWVADLPEIGVIGQVFISLRSVREDIADGSNRAYLYGFRVRPAYRDLGVGTHLMQVVENDLKQRGFRILTLNVGRDNPSAIRFYQRLGFRILHSDPGRWSYIDHQGVLRSVDEPAWRMEKVISRDQ